MPKADDKISEEYARFTELLGQVVEPGPKIPESKKLAKNTAPKAGG